MKTALFVSIIACALAAAPGAQASGVPVIDAVHLGISKFAWVEQYAQMREELQRQRQQYDTQLRQYEQMQLGASAFSSRAGHRVEFDEAFPERMLDEGVDKRCGADRPASGGRLAVRQGQYDVCVQIVRTGNRRFNVLRSVLAGIRDRDAEIQRLIERRNALGEDDLGRLEAVKADLAAVETRLHNDLRDAHATLEAYDGVLAGLHEQNRQLAAQAFKGGPGSAVGEVVYHGTLRLALDAARQRSR